MTAEVIRNGISEENEVISKTTFYGGVKEIAVNSVPIKRRYTGITRRQKIEKGDE